MHLFIHDTCIHSSEQPSEYIEMFCFSAVYIIKLYIFIQLQEKLTGVAVEKGPHYKPDPTGMRCGNPPGPAEENLVQTLRQTALDLEEYVSKVRFRFVLMLVNTIYG